MRKKVYGRQLSRETGSRRALYRSLIRALVEHNRINTTKAKAKSVIPMIDKVINLAKRNSVAANRRVFSILGNDKKTAKAIFEIVAPKFSGRTGGFTRIVNLPRRRGDLAKVVRLEWVENMSSKKTKVDKKKTKKSK